MPALESAATGLPQARAASDANIGRLRHDATFRRSASAEPGHGEGCGQDTCRNRRVGGRGRMRCSLVPCCFALNILVLHLGLHISRYMSTILTETHPLSTFTREICGRGRHPRLRQRLGEHVKRLPTATSPGACLPRSWPRQPRPARAAGCGTPE